MKTAWLLLLHTLLASLCFSQGYYPLEVGNRWDYGYLEFKPGEPTHFVHDRTVTVLGNTLLSNGHRYAVLTGNNLVRQGGDTVFWYNEYTGKDELMHYLTPNDSDTLTEYYPHDTVTTVIFRGADTLFGRQRTMWWFIKASSGSSFSSNTKVVDSIGYVYGDAEAGFNEYLLGAVINGTMYGTVAEVPPAGDPFPEEFSLSQNYPNPFNPSTTIRYTLPHRSYVRLVVFSTLGQEVAKLVNCEVEAGYHEVQFDGAELASGVYFYRLTAGDFAETRRLILLK